MPVNWTQAIVYGIVSVISAMIGGSLTGFVIAYRIGEWKRGVEAALTRHEERIDEHHKRLERGADYLHRMPVQEEQIKELRIDIRTLTTALNNARDRFVSKSECDLRHERGRSIADGT